MATTQISQRLPSWHEPAEAFIGACYARIERSLSRPLLWGLAVASLLAVQAALVLTHVAWLDEWQALQIAVQSPDFHALRENLRYEGHPPLWYLILRTAALAIPPLLVLRAVQLPIALALQALILFRAPFGRTERLLLGSSYFILFDFGALSRSLSLGALLVVAFFAARGRILPWIIVILLPMVDFQFGLLSIAAIVLLIHDRRWSTVGAALWLLSSAFAAWCVIPAPDIIPHHPPFFTALGKMVNNFSALLIPIQTVGGKLAWNGGLPWGIGVVAGPLFLLFALLQTTANPLHKWVFRGFLIVTCLFGLTAYQLSIRHLTLIALLMILLKWREVEKGGTVDLAFRAWLMVIALCGVFVAGISAVRPFDTSPAVAAYIRNHGLQDKIWVSWSSQGRAVPVGVLLNREMMMFRKGCTHSFIRWNYLDHIDTDPELKSAAREIADQYGRAYLISGIDLSPVADRLLQPLTTVRAGYDGVDYYLYVIAPDRPETGRHPPRCLPVRRPLRP